MKNGLSYLRGEFTSKSLALPHLALEEKAISDAMPNTDRVQKMEESRQEVPLYMATHQVWTEHEPVLIFSERDSLFRNDIFLFNYLPPAITLNACASMAGMVTSGSGNASMGQRMLEAGAQQVVASLWAVEDASSAVLGISYLQGMKSGLKSSVSLKKAKENYLSEADAYYTHPFFWAPLLHYGAEVELESPRTLSLFWLGLLPILFLIRWKIRISF